MFRTLYDSDVTVWSPQGRIHQIEYAMEAVKQGSACVGVRSDTHAVLATLMRSPSEMAGYQQKIFQIDDHMGIAISGLTSDGRVLCKYMRNECLNHTYIYGSKMRTHRLVRQVADKSQVHTQKAGRRPYGVGLLVIGYDTSGPHLYQTSPSGNYYDYHAQAIGSRSQSARTYLERTYAEYKSASADELIRHSLKALRETASGTESGLTTKNTAIAIVGKDKSFTVITGDALKAHLDGIEADAPVAGAKPELDEEEKEKEKDEGDIAMMDA